MKKITILIITLFSILSLKAHPKLSDTIIIDKTKSELFGNAIEWITNSFKSGKSVIDMADKESGKIIAKGYFESGREVKITIVVRDGKYRYDINIDNKVMDVITLQLKSKLSFSMLNPLMRPKDGFKTYVDIYLNPDSIIINNIYSEGYNGNKVFYNSDNKPMLTYTSKQNFIEWKNLVDIECEDLKKKYSSEYSKNIEIDNIKIIKFIDDFKIHMNKDEF